MTDFFSSARTGDAATAKIFKAGHNRSVADLPSFGLIWLLRQDFVTLGALLLSFFYVADYLGYAALPGNNPNYPLGWWGWWDQSKFLRSTRAQARLDFSPTQHW